MAVGAFPVKQEIFLTLQPVVAHLAHRELFLGPAPVFAHIAIMEAIPCLDTVPVFKHRRAVKSTLPNRPSYLSRFSSKTSFCIAGEQ